MIREINNSLKTFHTLHVFGLNCDLWDGICGVGSGTWKGRE